LKNNPIEDSLEKGRGRRALNKTKFKIIITSGDAYAGPKGARWAGQILVGV